MYIHDMMYVVTAVGWHWIWIYQILKIPIGTFQLGQIFFWGVVYRYTRVCTSGVYTVYTHDMWVYTHTYYLTLHV